MGKFSTIKKIDDRTFQITDYEYEHIGASVNVKYSSFVVLIVLIVGIVVGVVFLRNRDLSSENGESVSQTETEDVTVSGELILFSVDGFIIEESSTRYITREDLDKIERLSTEFQVSYKDLIDFAINEIYARYGCEFTFRTKFADFYNQYDWYLYMEKVSNVKFYMFNEYEQYNIILLVEEKKKLLKDTES